MQLLTCSLHSVCSGVLFYLALLRELAQTSFQMSLFTHEFKPFPSQTSSFYFLHRYDVCSFAAQTKLTSETHAARPESARGYVCIPPLIQSLPSNIPSVRPLRVMHSILSCRLVTHIRSVMSREETPSMHVASAIVFATNSVVDGSASGQYVRI